MRSYSENNPAGGIPRTSSGDSEEGREVLLVVGSEVRGAGPVPSILTARPPHRLHAEIKRLAAYRQKLDAGPAATVAACIKILKGMK